MEENFLEGLEYFTIGWNSENTLKELEKLKNNQECNQYLIRASGYPIIKNCENLFKRTTDPEEMKEDSVYEKLFPELFPDSWSFVNQTEFIENHTKTKNRIKKVKDITEKIMNNQKVQDKDLDLAIDLFNDLYPRCLDAASSKRPAPYF